MTIVYIIAAGMIGGAIVSVLACWLLGERD